MKKPDRLLFGTGGVPLSANPRDSVSGIRRLKELGLDSMELEYVYGSFPGERTAKLIAQAASENGIRLTAHGPYYINLNSPDYEKVKASRTRILKTAYYGYLSGAESITFHAAFNSGSEPAAVFGKVKEELANITAAIREQGIVIDVRPELTGKETQFGSLEDIIRISQEVEDVKPCIDWSHLFARTGAYNTASEFQKVIDEIRKQLGDDALKELHMHISGIIYGKRGEKQHISLDQSEFNYRDLIKVMKDNDVYGIVVCESPELENDALLLKDIYEQI